MYRKIVTLVIVSLLFSCAKENNETENQLNQNGSDAKMKVVNAQTYEKYQEALNFQNLNDFAGVIHNDILDELKGKEKNTQLVGLTEDEIIGKIIDEVSTKLRQKYANKGIDLGETPSVAQIKFIMSDAENLYSNVIKQSTTLRSIETQKVSEEFFSNMTNLSKEKGLNYERIKTEIESFERGIMGNSKLSKEEKDYILQGTSIARNSFYYWGKEAVPWEPNDPNIFQAGAGGGGFWRWFTVALADVAGYLITENLGTSIVASEYADKFFDKTQKQVDNPIKATISDDLFSSVSDELSPKTPNKTKEEPVDLSDEGVLVYEYEEIDTPRGKMFKIVGKRYDDPATYDPRRKKALDKALKAKAEGVMLPVDDIGKKP
jgi:hypothetical protein